MTVCHPPDAWTICCVGCLPASPLPWPPCSLDDKIRKLDEQLAKHREIIKKTRPGPAQEAAKRRALTVGGRTSSAAAQALVPSCYALLPCLGNVRLAVLSPPPLQVLKQKRLYESQRDQLYNQQFNVEQTSFAMTSMQVKRAAGRAGTHLDWQCHCAMHRTPCGASIAVMLSDVSARSRPALAPRTGHSAHGAGHEGGWQGDEGFHEGAPWASRGGGKHAAASSHGEERRCLLLAAPNAAACNHGPPSALQSNDLKIENIERLHDDMSDLLVSLPPGSAAQRNAFHAVHSRGRAEPPPAPFPVGAASRPAARCIDRAYHVPPWCRRDGWVDVALMCPRAGSPPGTPSSWAVPHARALGRALPTPGWHFLLALLSPLRRTTTKRSRT